MKLLIVTQVIDTEHPILGFFHRWIEEFAKHCEQVHVICLQAGKHSLPANVTVHTLGKESGVRRLTYLWRFYKLIWSLRHEYNSVFVHMNQVYVILGAPFWRAWGKRISLWYVHRQVTISLRVAVMLVYHVFSSVPQSMRVKTNKVHFVGHGIDVDTFDMQRQLDSNVFHIVHIGRITQIKNIDVLITAVSQLQLDQSVRVSLYGEPVTEQDLAYKAKLQEQITAHNLTDVVTFCGPVSHEEIPHVLASADVSVNLTPTGGLDKAVIESAAAGVPVITSNESFSEFLASYKEQFLIPFQDPEALAGALRSLIVDHKADPTTLQSAFKDMSAPYSVHNLISKIVSDIQS